MAEVLHREFVYIWYYFTIQLKQIFPYWVLGIVIGSLVFVFAKQRIHHMFRSLGERYFVLAACLVSDSLHIFGGKTRLFSKKNSLLISINFLQHYFDFYSESSPFNISSNRSAIGVKT